MKYMYINDNNNHHCGAWWTSLKKQRFLKGIYAPISVLAGHNVTHTKHNIFFLNLNSCHLWCKTTFFHFCVCVLNLNF